MKIIVNGKFLTQQVSGVQRYAMELSKRLKQRFPETIFVAPTNIIHEALARELNAKTIGPFKGHLWEQFTLPAFIRQQYKNQDYVLLNFTNTAPLCVKNNIVTLHDITFIKFAECYSLLFSMYYKFIIPKIIKKARLIFTVSETVKKELQTYFNLNDQNIAVTYNAIDAKVFNDQNIIPKTYSDIPSVESFGNYVLAVSMFNPIKNLERLVKAFKMAQIENHKLIVVGDHYKSFKKNRWFDTYKQDPDIIFLGRINDAAILNSLYRHARVFAFPSLYESFGIPPLEAMASGCPTIVSNAGALPEICCNATYYIDPNDVESIANALSKVLSSDELRRQLIKKGRERIRDFDWESSANIVVTNLSKIQNGFLSQKL